MRHAIAALALAAATAVPGLAQIPLNGPEFQVNTSTDLFSRDAAVASDPDGNFVVTWQELDGYFEARIRARRFDRYGVGLGDDFQVSSPLLTPSQSQPRVAVEPGGRFLVVFTSGDSYGTDDSLSSIQARLFDPTGNPLGPEFQVNEYTPSLQYQPAVAADGLGNFVVAWTCDWSPLANWSIRARRFDRDGAPLGGEFLVNGYTLAAAKQPDVAVDTEGRFVVVWSFNESWISARRFDAGGLPLGPDLSVSSLGRYPSVAFDPSGGFLVVWHWGGGRAFSADGEPLGAPFEISDLDGEDYFLDVASASDGDLAVPWWRLDFTGHRPSVVARTLRLDEPGEPDGDLVQISSSTTSNAWRPKVATNGESGFVVVWSESSYSSYGDRNVHARRLGDLFSDGFETGDTGRWSSAVP